MKKVLVIIGLTLVAVYLVFAAFYFQGKPKEGICTHLEIVVNNANDNSHFVDTAFIRKSIKEKGICPIGKLLKEISTNKIEEAVLTNKLVKKANVFVTNNGAIKIAIEEKKPILRIITNTSENYYIDVEGNKMPLSSQMTAYVPLATGAIKEDFAKNELYNFALFLQGNEFWDAQIEQIVVMPNQDITLIPRVGEHQIILGKLSGYQERLEKLLIFYENELNEIGWNKYSVINLKYDKQVVCTKR